MAAEEQRERTKEAEAAAAAAEGQRERTKEAEAAAAAAEEQRERTKEARLGLRCGSRSSRLQILTERCSSDAMSTRWPAAPSQRSGSSCMADVQRSLGTGLCLAAVGGVGCGCG